MSPASTHTYLSQLQNTLQYQYIIPQYPKPPHIPPQPQLRNVLQYSTPYLNTSHANTCLSAAYLYTSSLNTSYLKTPMPTHHTSVPPASTHKSIPPTSIHYTSMLPGSIHDTPIRPNSTHQCLKPQYLKFSDMIPQYSKQLKLNT